MMKKVLSMALALAMALSLAACGAGSASGSAADSTAHTPKVAVATALLTEGVTAHADIGKFSGNGGDSATTAD